MGNEEIHDNTMGAERGCRLHDMMGNEENHGVTFGGGYMIDTCH